MAKYVDLIVGLMPPVLRGVDGQVHFGQRLSGFLGGLLWDLLAEGASQAGQAAWVNLPGNPDDSLPLLGEENLLPAYAGELPDSHRTRIKEVWKTYPFAGDELVMVAQLAAAGAPGATFVFDDLALGPKGEAAPYWSQFWLFIPIGSHPATAGGPIWGAFNWGAANWGPTGLTAEYAGNVRAIIREWKPVGWVCRGIRLEHGGGYWEIGA
ncbi:MAG: hypothetical protein H0U56_15690 [Methylibium sp.]|nr:hypothetical protein [Methylibium sp.]